MTGRCAWFASALAGDGVLAVQKLYTCAADCLDNNQLANVDAGTNGCISSGYIRNFSVCMLAAQAAASGTDQHQALAVAPTFRLSVSGACFSFVDCAVADKSFAEPKRTSSSIGACMPTCTCPISDCQQRIRCRIVVGPQCAMYSWQYALIGVCCALNKSDRFYMPDQCPWGRTRPCSTTYVLPNVLQRTHAHNCHHISLPS
jgi:hypothetical protein